MFDPNEVRTIETTPYGRLHVAPCQQCGCLIDVTYAGQHATTHNTEEGTP